MIFDFAPAADDVRLEILQGFTAVPKKLPCKLLYDEGSTIGNFEPAEAELFLGRMAALAGTDGGVLIGVDLDKEQQTIERAYNDSPGVTAAFNLNLLKRIASEFGLPDFSGSFCHEAVFNEEHRRIEMQLVSKGELVLWLNGEKISFTKHERITTEFSYKYSLEQFSQIALRAGLNVQQMWSDPRKWFSVQYLTARGNGMITGSRCRLELPRIHPEFSLSSSS